MKDKYLHNKYFNFWTVRDKSYISILMILFQHFNLIESRINILKN